MDDPVEKSQLNGLQWMPSTIGHRLFGQNFGIVTDIQTGPNGNLFVVSLSDGAIYEIFRRS